MIYTVLAIIAIGVMALEMFDGNFFFFLPVGLALLITSGIGSVFGLLALGLIITVIPSVIITMTISRYLSNKYIDTLTDINDRN